MSDYDLNRYELYSQAFRANAYETYAQMRAENPVLMQQGMQSPVLEGRIAINTLIQRLPHLRLAEPISQLRYRSSPVVRGLERLPVVWNSVASK